MRKKFLFLFAIILFVTSLLIFSASVNSFSSFDSNFGELKVTLEHPFLIDGEWIEASQLEAGDMLTTIDGKKARIVFVEDVVLDEPISVYNLEDEYYHNYIVDGVGDEEGGVVVHNSRVPLKPTIESVKIVYPDGKFVRVKAVPTITSENIKTLGLVNVPRNNNLKYLKAISWQEGDQIYVVFWERTSTVHHGDALASLLELHGHAEWAGKIRSTHAYGSWPVEVLQKAEGFEFTLDVRCGKIIKADISSGITTGQILVGSGELKLNPESLGKQITAVLDNLQLPFDKYELGIGDINKVVDVNALKTFVDPKYSLVE